MFNPWERLQNLKIENRPFINGQFVHTEKTLKKISPIDSIELPPLYVCGEEEVNLAVKTALKTYKNKIWRDKTAKEKKRILLKLADLMEENREELALLDTIETGRSIKNFYYDSIPKAIEALRWFAEAVDKYLDYAVTPEKNKMVSIVKMPLGVVGIITPWNDPLVVAFWKIAPALLMGNSVVIKPAEQSTFSMLKVAELSIEAGIPEGVLNVITGEGETGKYLAMHNDVRGIFFTGSSEVGKKILQYAGMSNMKKVKLECGGKSAFILTKNYKNLKRAAEVLAKNIFYNQGQICSAPSRLIIDSKIKDEFLNLVVEESKKYIPSDPLSFETEVGNLVSSTQKERVEGYIKEGIYSGAKIISCDENIFKEMSIAPVILDNVPPDSPVAQEEIFGPVLVVIEYKDIKEAVEIANSTKYGLAASVWSDDINEANYVAKELEAGLVHINTYGEEDNQVPFGGVKESGIGRDKSILAFDEYSEIKTIWTYLEDIQ